MADEDQKIPESVLHVGQLVFTVSKTDQGDDLPDWPDVIEELSQLAYNLLVPIIESTGYQVDEAALDRKMRAKVNSDGMMEVMISSTEEEAAERSAALANLVAKGVGDPDIKAHYAVMKLSDDGEREGDAVCMGCGEPYPCPTIREEQ